MLVYQGGSVMHAPQLLSNLSLALACRQQQQQQQRSSAQRSSKNLTTMMLMMR